MSRKMLEIDLLIDAVNNVLALPDERLTAEPAPVASDPVSYRKGVYGTLEQALHMMARYRGFNHLPSEFIEGRPELGYREGYDDSRRYYY